MSTAIEESAKGQVLEHGSPRVHPGPIVFLLNNLPFDPEDDAPGTQPNLPYRPENLAATYILPLEQILSSNLNASGLISAIYLNFGPWGYYGLNPNTKPITRPAAFEAMLGHLFQIGTILNPETNEMLWHKVTDLSSLMSKLPADSRKIGCLHGAGSRGSISLQDYIRNASDEQIYVFVVGQIAEQEIETYIDEFVKVSETELVASYCLARVISAIETKCGI